LSQRGWRRKEDGTVYKDPEAEFDSDEEPPKPPPNLGIPDPIVTIEPEKEQETKSADEQPDIDQEKTDPNSAHVLEG